MHILYVPLLMNITYTTIVALLTLHAESQIYMRCDNIENAITDVIVRIANCIKDISSWMMHKSLQINENKTDFIISSTTSHRLKKHTLQVGTNIIGLSKTVKILGVTFDDSMTLKQHISNTCRSSYMQLQKINNMQQYLTTNAVKTLVQSVVISRQDYHATAHTLARAYLRGGGSGGSNPPETFRFFGKSEGNAIERKRKKKGVGGGWVGYFFTYFWGLIFFRVGLRYFQGG